VESDFCLPLQAAKGIIFSLFLVHISCRVAAEEVYVVLQFSGRALEITVWDYDKVGSSEFIGEVRLYVLK